jgi:hypothetical protein
LWALEYCRPGDLYSGGQVFGGEYGGGDEFAAAGDFRGLPGLLTP